VHFVFYYIQAGAKTKDAQLKRAAETIARLKQQLQESSEVVTVSATL
jgi:hypothetical protein